MANKFCPNLNHPDAQSIINKVGLHSFYKIYIENDYSIPPADSIISRDAELDSLPKTVEIINNNLTKINQWQSNKAIDEKTLWNKIQQLGVPKNQLELLKNSEGDSVSEKLINFIANYSYTVEINTAKEPLQDYEMVDITGEGDFEPKEFIPDTEFVTEEDEYGNVIGVKEVLSEKGKKQIKDRENKRKNTQHYFNLTVPGGTNYTENEIATPAITPSIKGHAQFSTDNGIGWFRSDDKIDTNYPQLFSMSEPSEEELNDLLSGNYTESSENLLVETLTKTRRILELQSDLFQKGRDKKVLEKDLNTAAEQGMGLEEIQESLPQSLNKNQFLQLLNKDNNWVTFFVKSIIQDSAKKGYEKVLFPLGDTASKIEGHTTLEEFKKQKEDRLNVLQSKIDSAIEEGVYDSRNDFLDLKYIRQDGKWYQQVEGDTNLNREYTIEEIFQEETLEINQLKQEIERVETEGFGALRPIYNFYENTVANILNKQYKDRVAKITDEFGNSWVELTLDNSDSNTVFYNIDAANQEQSVQDMLFVNRELFNAHQQNSIKNSIIAQIRNYINTFNTEVILTSKDIRDTVLADFENSRDYYIDSTDPEEVEMAKNLSNVIDNFDKFWELANAELSKLGIKQKPITGIQEDNGVTTEESAYDSEESLYQKLNYSDESTFEQSSKDTASAHMKLLLSVVPKYEYENGQVVTYVDENGVSKPVEARNLIGLMEFEPLDVIWNDMLYSMVDIPMGQKINYLQNSSNAKHRAIYELLKDNPQLQNEFEVTFSKQQAKFITAVARRLTPRKVYNKTTGLWDNMLDPDGNIMYENRTISILDTNRSNPENTLIADWYNNFLMSSLVVQDNEGNLIIDTDKGKKLKEFYEIAMAEDNMNNVRKALRTIGIFISENSLNSPGIYIEKELVSPKKILMDNASYIFDRIAGETKVSPKDEIDLSEVPDNPIEENNPFLLEDRPLSILARLENKVNPGVFETSFISGDNKAKYSFVNNTYATWQFNKLINSREYLEKLKTTAYAGESHWLDQLLNNPTFLKNFEYRYVDTLGNDSNNQTNKTFGKMNTKEKEYYRISLFQNQGQRTSRDYGSPFVGYFIGLTPSDKTTLPVFKSVMTKVTVNKDLMVNSGTLDILRKQFISEYKRVKQTIDQNNDPNIIPLDNYHGKNGMGTKFIVFPMMNKLLMENGNLMPLDDARFDTIIMPALEQFAKELIEDQIDYWTSLGLYNESILDKSYANRIGLNDKNVESKLREFAANYAINNFIALMNQTQLFSGDPALHGKLNWEDVDKTNLNIRSSIKQTWINYFKRMAKDIAPGLDPNFTNSQLSFDNGDPKKDTSKFFNTIFLKDLSYSSKHLTEYRKVIGDKVLNKGSYGFINPADAQEYTTLREHLTVMNALGKLSEEQIAAGKRLLDEGSLESDIELILQPMKPVYVEGVVEDGINKMYYIKTSSFPLIPALTKGLEIDKLRVAMEENNIQRAVYESGVKLGVQGKLSNVSSDGGVTFNELTISPEQVITLPRSGFRIQQEIPYHGEDSMTNQGSQGRKLILNNVDDSDVITYNNQQISGKEAKRIFERLHIEKMTRAFEDFKKEIGVDEATGKITNLNNLAEILRKEAVDRDYPLNDVYSISIIEENGVPKFKIPLAFTQSSQRFESILNSIVTNRVLKYELPGFALVQGASPGFSKVVSDERLEEYASEIIWVNPEETTLNYITEKKGRLVSADILVPNYLRDNEGKLIDLSQYVVGGYLATDSIPEELLTIIGLRIPTQGLNSMMKFRVKGFLPSYMGDLAIVPAEITSQMGSDFDVDKLFFFNYHHTMDKEGNLKKITKEMDIEVVTNEISIEIINNYFTDIFDMSKLPEGYSIFTPSMYNLKPHEILSTLKGILSGDIDLNISDDTVLQEVKETLVEVVKKLSTGEFNLGTSERADLDFSKLSKKEIDNLIIQMYEDRLSDVNAFSDIIEPNGFGSLPEVSEFVSSLGSKTASVHTFGSREQNDIYEINSSGKMGTALFSLASTFLKAAQDSKLYLVSGTLLKFKNSKGDIVNLNNLFEINNIEGGKRSNVIMYLQSAAVDNAKEQILGNLNINDHTMNVASTMAMLGLTEDFIGYFMAQPIIKEFTAIMANKSDIIDGSDLTYDTADEIIQDLISSKVRGKSIAEVMATLRKIIYGADHLKELLEFKSKDPNADYLPVEANSEITDLKEYVSDIFELKILVDFSNFLEISNHIRTLQSAINPDTKGLGTSFASLESKFIQVKNIVKSLNKGGYGVLNPFAVYELIGGETSAASALNILNETRDIFSSVNLYSGSAYSGIIEPILTKVGLAPTESNLKDIYSNFKSYLLSSGNLINTEDVNKLRDELLFDPDKNIAKRWHEYSMSPRGKSNILTNRIKPKFQSTRKKLVVDSNGKRKYEDVLDTNSYNGLTANNTPASSNAQDINNATMYFYDMINSENDTERALAEDMVKYFILTGASFGPSSIGKYINYDILEKYNFSQKSREISQKIVEGSIEELLPFIDQYFQNNPFKAKSVALKEIKDSFFSGVNNPGLMTTLNVPASYVVSYDDVNKEPVLFKMVGLSDDGNYIKYSRIPVLGNKQLKRYNYNSSEAVEDTSGFDNRIKINLPTLPANPKEIEGTTVSGILSDKYSLNTGNVNSILESIARLSQVPQFAELANNLLRNIPEGFSLNIIEEVIPGNGSYNREDNTIRINTERLAGFTNYNDKFEQVFLEELIHALTVNNLLDNNNLTPKQQSAKNKIVRLYNEYIKEFANKEDLEKFKGILKKPAESRTSEEVAFLNAHMDDLYPLINVAEFIGQGLTKLEFREKLQNNNFWTRLIDLIKNLLGIENQSDLDFLFSNTLDLIQENQEASRIEESYPPSIEEFSTDKLLEIRKVFSQAQDNTIADQRDFNYESLREYGMTDAEYAYAVNNQEILNKLLLQNTNATTFSDLITDLLEKNVIRRDKNQLSLFNIDDLNEFNINEYNTARFVEQRDEFFRAYKVKNYWPNNMHKKYTAESQRRLLGANENTKYDRLRIEFHNNELRVRRVDPPIDTDNTFYNIDEEAAPKSREDKYIDRILSRFENTINRLEARLKTTSDEAEKAKLNLQLEKARAKIEQYKLDRSLIQIVDAIEKRINRIDNIIKSDNIDYNELFESFDYLKEFIMLNQEVEFDTDTELGKKYKEKADKLSGRASSLVNKLKDKAANVVQEWAVSEIDWAKAPNIASILSHGIKDVGAMESGNLDATRSSSEHIQALEYLINYAQYKADDRHSEFMEELVKIEKDYHKQYGKDYSQLYQLDSDGKPTKYLLNKYQDEYYKTTRGKGKFKVWRENTQIEITEENRKAFEEAKKTIKEIATDEDYLVWLRDHDPDAYVKDFNSGKRFNSGRGAKQFVTTKPIDKWIDPRYTELMNLPDSDPAKRMYLFIEPIFRKLNRKYNSGQVNYVPELGKDTIEYFTSGNLKGGISKLWTDFANDIRSDVYVGPDGSLDLDPFTREPRLRIPVRFFGDNIKTENRSTDLARIAEIVMYQEESNKVKHEIEPLLNIYYVLLRDAKQTKGIDPETGDMILIDKPASRTSEQAEYIINGWLYGLYRSTEENEQKYGKMTDAVINYVRLNGMGYNPFSALGNIMQGFMSNYTFAGGGQFFGQTDFLKATSTMLYSIAGKTGNAKKISNAFIYYNSFVRHNEMNHGLSRELRSARSSSSKWLDPMILQQSGEYFVQGQTMLGILFKTKIKNLKGETKSLWDAYDNNFNWKTEEFGENPYEKGTQKHFNLQMRIRKAIDDIHGNYARPIMNKKHFYWRLVYTFRTWLPQAINNRFGEERTDILLGDTTKGRYRSYSALWKGSDGKFDFDVLKQNIRWFFKLGSKNNLSDLDMQNLRKNLSELILLATITAALMLLRAGMDDWDEETKEIWTYSYNNLMRARGDIMFFMDPSAAQTILRDPVAAMGALNNFIDVFEASISTVAGEGVYQAGYWKGNYKIVKETIDVIPLINQIPKNLQYADKVFNNR